MKYLICQNNKGSGKYFKGRVCNEQVEVDDSTVSVLCWKCLALLMPMPEEKKPTGYPRGWKFMSEFVDKDGNVYHKGQLQQDLFGTLPPTEIKETKKERKRKTSLDDKILSEFKKRSSKKKSKKNK
jgi:hypothetical protein